MKIPRAVQRKIDAKAREEEWNKARIIHEARCHMYLRGACDAVDLTEPLVRFMRVDARVRRSNAAEGFALARKGRSESLRQFAASMLKFANRFEWHAHNLEKYL